MPYSMWNLRRYFVVFIISATCHNSGTATTFQQTVPAGGAAVCLSKKVQFTCVGETYTRLTEIGSKTVTEFSTAYSKVGYTSTAGAFKTELTDINGDTLTSTATIQSVSLGDAGRSITCHSYTGVEKDEVKLEGPPDAPSNLAVNTLSSTAVSLSWSLDNDHCVVSYQVQVNSDDPIPTVNNAQQTMVSVESDKTYTLRVRGVDTADRLGEWSPYISLAAPCGGQGLTGAAIVGIVIVLLIGVI